INVTIPYKKDVIPFCSALSGEARAIGSVNTILRRSDGTLYGDNTDFFGFEYMVRKSGVSAEGKKCVVFGSGGASATVIAALRHMGAREVVCVSRSGEDNYSNLSRHYDADILVNATPVGMYPDVGVSVAKLSPFTAAQAAFDLVYNPALTEFLRQARDMGMVTVNGLSMLTAQAARACELFTGGHVSDERIDEITQIIQRQTKNIVLIGMPGCGKTSVGRALANLTGRQFVDIDEQIVLSAGKSIPEIFIQDGQERFRMLETAVLSEFSKRSGLVIATGGGIVTKHRNLPLLRQNSVTLWLRRPIEELPSDGRPLSQSLSPTELYRQRRELYEQWAEQVVDNTGVEETAEKIKKELML
ncbi:MAG: AAA family ATPase, partial [Oscillospiraceae bacterium]|nr:AAA family ATPase [Oscillospiraceae bacterium]